MIRFTGYKQSPPDSRDYTQENTPQKFKHIWHTLDSIKTPDRFYLWTNWPKIEDQLLHGACVLNGATTIIEYNQLEREGRYDERSRRGAYYDCLCRDKPEGPLEDVGTTPRTAMWVASHIGVGLESLCPYDVQDFFLKPSDEYYADAAKRKIRAYFRIEKFRHITACLAIRKPPIIAIPLYDSFFWDETVKTGIVPYPSLIQLWRGPRGYHLVTAGDFDHNKERIGFANSYGLNWGNQGRFWLSYKYIEKLVLKNITDHWFILK
jgi:hypothetical protein